MSKVVVLPGVTPALPPPERPERSFSFHFSRRQGGWYVGLHDGSAWRNMSCYGMPATPTKAEARNKARAYAEEHGIPYAEWSKPPPPTAAEEAMLARGSSYFMIGVHDDRAEKHEKAGRWREAAEEWTSAARGCEQAIEVSPGAASHLAECASNRIGHAIRALSRWRGLVSATAPTDGLRLLPGSREEGT